ncbi:MAG: FAD-dependent oxidoreductase [Gammaproteobacteria bacterium]|nr:FAD-dependent oxidoreductase [Gammaproteobacteria bacterium]
MVSVDRRCSLRLRSTTRRHALKALGVAAAGLAGGRRSRAQPEPPVDVLVLGAGLAGLAGARRLSEAGLRVLVIEARDRPGGRVYTRFDLPDRAELGAVEVGDTYTRVHALARACGLAIGPSAPPGAGGLALHVNGQTLDARDWDDSPANPLTGVERAIAPYRLEAHYLASPIPFAQASDWDTAQAAVHDRSITTVLEERGVSAEALRLVNVAGNHQHSDQVSVLGWWRGALARRQDTGSGRLEAGAGALAECLATGVNVRYGSVVTEIVEAGGQMYIRVADGAEYRARRCICTLPLPVLAGVRLRLPLASATRRAIEETVYTRVTVALFDAAPFWEEDGLPPTMWTDTPLERIFPRRHSQTREIIGLKAFVNGAGTTFLDRLDEAAFEELALTTLARVRPSAAGRVRYLARHAWGSDPFARGAYAAWPPGRVAASRAALSQPVGPMHFAGEHVADAPGIEGAIRSGERAASAILEALAA